MFYNCISLKELDISNFDMSKCNNINDADDMFHNVDLKYLNIFNIKHEINIGNEMNSKDGLKVCQSDKIITNPKDIYVCSSNYITIAYLNNIVIYENGFMNGRNSMNISHIMIGERLIIIDEPFNITNNEIITIYFREPVTTCEQFFSSEVYDSAKFIKSIDLSHFDSSQVTNMNKMFEGCESLKSIDLSVLNTSKLTSLKGLLDECSSLKSINISKFDTSKVTDFSRLFKSCSALTSLDLTMLDTSSANDMSNMFNGCSSLENLDISNFNFINCKNTSNMFDTLCNLKFINLTNIQNSDNVKDLLNTLNESNDYNCPTESDIIKSNTKLSLKNIANDNYLDSLIDNTSQLSHLIQGENYNIIVKPINKFIPESSINIDFSNCLNILKQINPDREYHIVQMNIKNNDYRNLIDNVEYKVYDDNSNEVDLTPCNDVTIEITYKLNNKDSINFEQISSFAKLGIDVFNINDPFFNDICYPYSDVNTDADVILKDRVKDMFQNYSVCEEGCEYKSFNITEVSVKCDCKVKKKITGEKSKPKFETYILASFLNSNFGVIKCYNLVFSLRGKLKNYGFWLFLSLIILQILCLVFYCKNGINPISNYLSKEMENNGYNVKDSIDNPSKKKNKLKKIAYHPRRLLNKDRATETNEMILIKKKQKLSKKKFRYNQAKENINNLNTIDTMNNDELKVNKNNEKREKSGFNIIKLSANNNSNYTPLNSNYELNNYDYSEAILYERRSFFRLYFIIFISKENIFNLIFFNPPLELKPLRICIFIFSYTLDISLNAFFYLSENISDKYNYKGNYRILFSLINNLAISLVSTIVSSILMILFQSLSESSDKIKNLFEEQETKMKNDKTYLVSNTKKIEINNKIINILKCLGVKIILLIIFEFLVLLFFFYYITAFCHVYESTQSNLLLDTVSSIILGIFINMVIAFIETICYILAIKYKLKLLYTIILYLY